MTIDELIQKVTEQFQSADLFYGHGTDNAADEAFALICYVLDIPFDDALDREVTTEEVAKVDEFVARRIKERRPLAYLTHVAYFAGLPFYVDERVLIPRSPFAELIEQRFQPWINPEKVGNVLDMCTGSGCMAIAAAFAFPNAQVDAVDLSADALAVAKMNCERFEIEDRVHLIQSDLFQNLPPKKYDIIMSNPPYVTQGEAQTFPSEYQHEPVRALETEGDALDMVEVILQEAPKYLAKNGILVVEVGDNRAKVEKRFPQHSFIWLELERGEGDLFLLM